MISQVADTILTIGLIAGLVVVFVVTIVLFKVGILGKARVKPGHRGKAVVQAVERDPSRDAKGLIPLKLVLEIQLPGRESYMIRTKRKVSASEVESIFQPGQVLDVIIMSDGGEEVAIVGFDAIPNAYAGAKSNLV